MGDPVASPMVGMTSAKLMGESITVFGFMLLFQFSECRVVAEVYSPIAGIEYPFSVGRISGQR